MEQSKIITFDAEFKCEYRPEDTARVSVYKDGRLYINIHHPIYEQEADIYMSANDTKELYKELKLIHGGK